MFKLTEPFLFANHFMCMSITPCFTDEETEAEKVSTLPMVTLEVAEVMPTQAGSLQRLRSIHLIVLLSQ